MNFDIKSIDMSQKDEVWQRINQKTKPIGSLGLLEKLAAQIAFIQGRKKLSLAKPRIILFAGDHGLAKEAISPYPQSVTVEMLRNFMGEGAAINVFARQHSISLDIVDCGVKGAVDLEGIINCRLGSGTRNSLKEPALSEAQLDQGIKNGSRLVLSAFENGCKAIGFGEMGIGNSSAAALLTSSILGVPLREVVGRGTGCNDRQLAQKTEILEKVLARTGPITDPWDAMREFGGFELATALGSLLKAASLGMVTVIDGFIMSAVALCAIRLYPPCQGYFIFSHKSASPGHRIIWESLAVDPILDFEMRLGEGSGVAVAWPILESAVRFYNEMSSFAEAEVSTAHD